MNNPFDFFDKVYCINLKEREDRWQDCLKNFERYDLKNFERIEAIKVNGDIHPKRKGQIGCALSFAKCFEQIKKNNYKKVLIFEDDFTFKYNKNQTFEKLNLALQELPENWDSLFLGGTLINDYGIFPIQKHSDNLLKLQSAHCLHSVAFSEKGVNKIFEFFKNQNDWKMQLINNFEAIDIFFASNYQNKTNSFITSDLLCYQRVTVSNIENAIYDYSQWMDTNFNYFKSIL